MCAGWPIRARCSPDGAFPGSREKCRERLSFRPIWGKAAPKSARIRSSSGKIPYAAEQGTNSAHQGIKVPCSIENRDIAPLTRRLIPFPRLRAPLPQLAGEGGRRSRPDGVWPAAPTSARLHKRRHEPSSSHPRFPHPIRRLRRHLPRFAEKGARLMFGEKSTSVHPVAACGQRGFFAALHFAGMRP